MEGGERHDLITETFKMKVYKSMLFQTFKKTLTLNNHKIGLVKCVL